jgi:hypothetical protein
MSRLAEAADMHASTVAAMMYGSRTSQAEKIDQVADAISDAWRLTEESQRLTMRSQVHRAVGRALRATEPFKPHPDADLLTPMERKTVNELIRLLALSKKEDARSETSDANVSELPSRGNKIESGREAARTRRPKP